MSNEGVRGPVGVQEQALPRSERVLAKLFTEVTPAEELSAAELVGAP